VRVVQRGGEADLAQLVTKTDLRAEVADLRGEMTELRGELRTAPQRSVLYRDGRRLAASMRRTTL